MRKVKFLKAGDTITLTDALNQDKKEDLTLVNYGNNQFDYNSVKNSLNNSFDYYLTRYKGYGEFTPEDRQSIKNYAQLYLDGFLNGKISKSDSGYYTVDEQYSNYIDKFRSKDKALDKNRNYNENDSKIIALSILDNYLNKSTPYTEKQEDKSNLEFKPDTFILKRLYGNNSTNDVDFAKDYGDVNESGVIVSNTGRLNAVIPQLQEYINQYYSVVNDDNLFSQLQSKSNVPSEFTDWGDFKNYINNIHNALIDNKLTEEELKLFNRSALKDWFNIPAHQKPVIDASSDPANTSPDIGISTEEKPATDTTEESGVLEKPAEQNNDTEEKSVEDYSNNYGYRITMQDLLGEDESKWNEYLQELSNYKAEIFNSTSNSDKKNIKTIDKILSNDLDNITLSDVYGLSRVETLHIGRDKENHIKSMFYPAHKNLLNGLLGDSYTKPNDSVSGYIFNKLTTNLYDLQGQKVFDPYYYIGAIDIYKSLGLDKTNNNFYFTVVPSNKGYFYTYANKNTGSYLQWLNPKLSLASDKDGMLYITVIPTNNKEAKFNIPLYNYKNQNEGNVEKKQLGGSFSNTSITSGNNWYSILGSVSLPKLYEKFNSASPEELKDLVDTVNDLQDIYSGESKNYQSLQDKSKVQFSSNAKDYQQVIHRTPWLDDLINNPLHTAQEQGIIKYKGNTGDNRASTTDDGLWGEKTELRTIIGKINSIPKEKFDELNTKLRSLNLEIYGDEGLGVNKLRWLRDPNTFKPIASPTLEQKPQVNIGNIKGIIPLNTNEDNKNGNNPEADYNPIHDPVVINGDNGSLNAGTVAENPLNNTNVTSKKYVERSPKVDLTTLGLGLKTINDLEQPPNLTPKDPVRNNAIVTDNYALQVADNQRASEFRDVSTQMLRSNPEDYLSRMTQISDNNAKAQQTVDAQRENLLLQQRDKVMATENANNRNAVDTANINSQIADSVTLGRNQFRNQRRNKIFTNIDKYLRTWATKGDMRDKENFEIDKSLAIKNAVDSLYDEPAKQAMLNAWNSEEGNKHYNTFEELLTDANYLNGVKTDGTASSTAQMSSQYQSDIKTIKNKVDESFYTQWKNRTHMYDLFNFNRGGKIVEYLSNGGRTYSERRWKELTSLEERKNREKRKEYNDFIKEYNRSIRHESMLNYRKDRDMAAFIASIYSKALNK
jgi:hypothetical protein